MRGVHGCDKCSRRSHQLAVDKPARVCAKRICLSCCSRCGTFRIDKAHPQTHLYRHICGCLGGGCSIVLGGQDNHLHWMAMTHVQQTTRRDTCAVQPGLHASSAEPHISSSRVNALLTCTSRNSCRALHAYCQLPALCAQTALCQYKQGHFAYPNMHSLHAATTTSGSSACFTSAALGGT